ncbi:T9SS type A sorting domain-containing protein [Moheibacter sediminis]|uniref:Por secretion system C-terminal sorting domain-containing protein n=1 Tax=Moheibacter sediminis TaxID=1434700 RepID=A0A1W2CUC9_9FLAO|nr:T9SS type A sorting domain-containing protein [Moheibacter sediminis]SMC88811.1 Por secretion system C-terminal sorting domain-containing protein [Moheibacter sediminis]
MKKILLCVVTAMMSLTSLNAQVDEFGYTTVELTTGPAYANRVFFDLSENNIVSHPANNWDVAFWRINAMDYGTRVNDAQNIEVYEASDNPADWDAISIANLASWGEPLYNPDQTTYINEGAFEQGSITSSNPNVPATGWGIYNPVNHHIEGKAIFVLKYVSDESYVKFMIEDYYGAYTIKYAKWNGSSWDATQTKTIANGSNNNYFNYFSFDTNDVVTGIEPEIGTWDLMFTRYFTFYMNIMMYRLSGVIQSPTLEVARVEETQATNTLSNPSEYSKVITAIGHSWKPTTGVYDNVVYYIKEAGQIYRLYFIENGGASNGNMYFKYKNITDEMGVTELNKDFSFGLYPNPTVNKQVTLVYDVKNASNASTKVSIFNLAGQKVYESNIQNQSGFYQKELNLNSLTTGTYVVVVESGNNKANKKLIVK